jgi:leader peptidase (prepilin peptidase)/N-methyltransferase
MSVATLGILAANAFVHSGAAGSLVRAITGAALLAALHLIAAVTTRGGIGSGDVRLAVPVGLILGWHSWSALATGTVLGLISTSVAAVVTRTFDRGKGGTMPHGPGMLIGAFIATLT